MKSRYLRTSDIAQAVGVHPNTVRLYEDWGYIPPAPRGRREALSELRQEMVPGIWLNFMLFNLYGDPSLTVMGPVPAFTVSPTDAFYNDGPCTGLNR